MSYKGIDKIIAEPGTEPQAASLRKISDWYIRRAAAIDSAPSPETVRAALATLVHHLPIGRQSEAAQQLLETLDRFTREAEVARTGWLDAVIREEKTRS
jgi:hypothetical protein